MVVDPRDWTWGSQHGPPEPVSTGPVGTPSYTGREDGPFERSRSGRELDGPLGLFQRRGATTGVRELGSLPPTLPLNEIDLSGGLIPLPGSISHSVRVRSRTGVPSPEYPGTPRRVRVRPPTFYSDRLMSSEVWVHRPREGRESSPSGNRGRSGPVPMDWRPRTSLRHPYVNTTSWADRILQK